MDERDFRDFANADLLMAPKRHLPSWKSEKHDTIRMKKIHRLFKKRVFVWGLNMFYAVVNQDNIIRFAACWTIVEGSVIQKVFCYKVAFLPIFSEKGLGIFNLFGIKIYSFDIAAQFCKRKQISTFATAYFQDTSLGGDVNIWFQVINIVFSTGVSQLVEILSSVNMALLHNY